MKSSTPPPVATWLLKHFGSDPKGPGNHDAIAGDLVEHFQEGRSRLWYWRQVLLAIARPEGWSALTVVSVLVIGWLMAINITPMMMRLILQGHLTFGWVYLSFLAVGLVTGGLLALLNRPYHLAPMLFFVVSYLGRDLYRLLIWPGIRLTPSNGPSRLYVVTWLYWTAGDVIFVAGVFAAGIVIAYRSHTASAKPATNA